MGIKSARVYSDLDFNFIANPNTGDVEPKYNVDAVNRALRNLVLTNRFERKFQPEVHGGIRDFLFEPLDNITRYSLKTQIQHAIEKFEKRVEILNIDITDKPENSSLELDITYTILNIIDPITTKIYVKRVR